MKKKSGVFQLKLASLFIISLILFVYSNGLAQDKNYYVRIVNIVVDPTHLETFKAALKDDIHEAIQSRTGVLTLHAVYDKAMPAHVTVF